MYSAPWLGGGPTRMWLRTEKVLLISTVLLVLGAGLAPSSCPESWENHQEGQGNPAAFFPHT